MSLPLAIASYIIVWWLVFFAVLPVGISTQDETGEVARGTPGSAPARHRLPLKLLATTLLSAAIFAGIYYVIEYKALSLDDIPFLPKFEPAAGPQTQ